MCVRENLTGVPGERRGAEQGIGKRGAGARLRDATVQPIKGRVSDTDPLRVAGGQIPEGPSSAPRRAPSLIRGCDPRWRSAADAAWLPIAMECRRPLRPR